MPMLPTGLHRHPTSGVFYLRRRIPTDLLACFPGKAEVGFSLKTKDYRSAIERHRHEEAKLTAEWERLREKLADDKARQQVQALTCLDSLPPDAIDAICNHFEAVSLAGDEERRTGGNYTYEEIEEYQEGYVAANRMLKAAVAVGDLEVLRRPLEQFLQLFGYRVSASEDEMRRLTLAYGRAAIRTNDKLLNRFQGIEEPTPIQVRTLASPTLSRVVREYAEYYEKLKKSAMLLKVNSVLPLLLDVVGDKPIGTLKQSDLEAYFDIVQKLPPRWRDICRKRNLSPRQLAELGLGEISKGTFDGTYLAVLIPFVRYCRRKWQDEGWPMTLTVEGVKYTGSRQDPEFGQRAFEPEELRTLFQGTTMQALAMDASRAHQFWLPHLGLFTGARVNEICQLNPQADIQQDKRTGIWFLDITTTSETDEQVKKSIKNSVSKRKVPIHSKLLELGFLDYVGHIRKLGHKLLFPGFPPSKGKASPKAEKWFRQLMRDLGLRDETPNARLVGMHAFRSTFLRQAMVLEVINAEAITGHVHTATQLEVQDGQVSNQKSAVVKKYEGELPLDMKQRILERIQYAGLSFHKPAILNRD